MNVHSKPISAAAELKASALLPFEQARAMPKSVYTSDEFLAQEIEHVFAKDWFCAGRASSLKHPGDYITLELAGQPIMVVRDAVGQLRAQSNVCLHRMSTLLEGSGNTRSIVCPYHAWTYNLDGSLRGAPAMTLNEGFKKDGYCLPQVRCEEWLGWIMVSLNPDAKPASKARRRLKTWSANTAWSAIPRPSTKPMSGTRTGRSWLKTHGELSSSRLPCRHHWRLVKAGRNGLPARQGGVQLSLHSEGRQPEDRAGASVQYAP